MSLDTLNNGDSGLEARTKINAAIGEVNAGFALVRGKGTLTGNTVAPTPPSHASGALNFSEWSPGATGTINFTINGSAAYTLTLDMFDPSNGTIFVDLNMISDRYALASAVLSQMSNFMSSDLQNIALSGDSAGVVFETIATGAGASIFVTASLGGSSVSGGNGSEGIGAYGGVQVVDLIAANGSKVLKPVRIWVYSEDQSQAIFSGVNVQLTLIEGFNNYSLGIVPCASFGGAELEPFSNYSQEWIAGRASAKLQAAFTIDEGFSLPVGGQVTVYAIAEQL